MISTRSLSKWFGPHAAVNDVDIDVPAGRVFGFLGPNGAGKSTTLRILSGFIPPTGGTATIAGFDVVRQSREVRRRLGYLPESTPLYPEMRVSEYLRFRARLYELSAKQRSAAIESVLRRCWLQEVARKPIAHLSKGYRQRLGLAAALLHNPPVLLLDEPTSGLDPTQIRAMRGLIRELAGDHTVLLSTHILSEVETSCDGVVMIVRGRIRAQGLLDQIRRRQGRVVYVVEARADGRAEGALRRVDGSATVEAKALDASWVRYDVAADAGSPDLREAIAGALSSCGVAVRDIHRQEPGLEQVFMRLISGEAPDDSGGLIGSEQMA